MTNKQYVSRSVERRILGVLIHDISQEKVMELVKQFLENDEFNLIFTPNPEICLKAEKNENYRKVLNQADINIPDGVGLKVGATILEQTLQNRLTGADLVKSVLNLANEKKLKVLIINNSSRKKTFSPSKVIEKLFNEKYPQVRLSILATDENRLNKNFEQLKESYDIVLCAKGAPYQEMILTDLKEQGLNAQLGIGIGGSLDFLTGTKKRAPKWWQDRGMEWFYRLIKQPTRIKRITDATVKFPLKCFEWQQRMKVEYRSNVLGVIKKGDKFLIQNNRHFYEDHWQFPQGGVEKKESLKKAVLREISEELGAPQELFKIIKQLPVEHSYIWPRWAQLLRGYKGQSQKIFLLEYLGNDQDFDFSNEDEVQEIKWVTKEELIDWISPKRQDSLLKILKYL